MTEIKRKYYILNRKRILENKKRYYQENKLAILKKHKVYLALYYQKNKKKYRERQQKYLSIPENRLKRNQKYNYRRRNDINFNLRCGLKTRLYIALKRQNVIKNDKVLNYLGCSIKFLRNYLEKKFKPKMTWKNYGKWHIDHIKPCASFDLSRPKEQAQCFHYSNLQPLWAIDNFKKGDNYV